VTQDRNTFEIAAHGRINLPTPVSRSIQSRFEQLAALDVAHEGQAVLRVDINIPLSTQVYRVAQTLARVDTTFRRATAAFVSAPAADGYFRPLSTLTSGLLFESVEIGSYHGRHRLHGQSLSVGARRPTALALVFFIMSQASSAYLVPNLPGQRATQPAVPPTRSPGPKDGQDPARIEFDLRIRSNSPLAILLPPPKLPPRRRCRRSHCDYRRAGGHPRTDRDPPAAVGFAVTTSPWCDGRGAHGRRPPVGA